MDLLTVFNDREKAIGLWLLIGLGWALFNKSIREAFFSIVKAFIQFKVFSITVGMVAYIIFIVFLLYKLGFWNTSLFKDTFVWTCGTAFVLLLNATKATRPNQDKNYFKGIMEDNLKLAGVFEFVVNFYTFPFWVEFFLLLPAIFLASGLRIIAVSKKDNKMTKALDFLLMFLGLSIIVFTVFNATSNFKSLMTFDNLRDFLLPLILATALTPFLYLFILFMVYENLYTRLGIFNNDNVLLAPAKKKIFLRFKFNLIRVNEFSKSINFGVYHIEDETDIPNAIETFNRSHSRNKK